MTDGVGKTKAQKSAAGGRVPTRLAGATAATEQAEDPRSISVALALLKYFYWIEIGIRSYLRSRDNLELSRAEGLVIATVMLGYQRPSDIARQLGVSRQAIHVTLGQMKKKGFIDLIPDPLDGRIKQVVPTSLAAKMNADGVVAMDYLWSELGQRVGKTDLNRLAKVLRADWGPPVIFDEERPADPWGR